MTTTREPGEVALVAMNEPCVGARRQREGEPPAHRSTPNVALGAPISWRWRRALLLPLLLMSCAGCGYASGSGSSSSSSDGYQWKSLHRPGVRTVAVGVFTTKSFRRGEEVRLTQAIARQIEAYTPYKVAPRDTADTVLEGQIRSIRRPRLSDSSNGGVPNEQLFQMTVDFTWKDLRTGKILVSRTEFEQIAAYYPTLGEGSFVGSQEAAEKLALAIVQELEADW